MTISKRIENILSKSSGIRKMFEEGARLKAKHGTENVYDFSLGNPNIKPPHLFYESLDHVLKDKDTLNHSYMQNNGYANVRKSVAEYISKEQQSQVSENEVIMTCGAAGALNVIMKTILDPGDEVISPVPHFPEYFFFADNHGGVLKTVPTKPDFSLDIEAISAAVTKKTKAIIINSPNNPTGQIYSEDSLRELGSLLKSKSEEIGETIYLVSDEPYRKIVYDGITVPATFPQYNESIIVTSYSKDLSIPGERIGYMVVNPQASLKEKLVGGLTFSNRILGFANAPALMQRVIESIQGVCVDISIYSRKRELFCKGLKDCGYDFETPPGAFYLFPKSPINDDVEFVNELLKELVLVTPGSSFGGPGHFRIAFCVNDETIVNSLPIFKKVMDKYK